ncbi:hypothetical protein SLS57_010004 [Botryosphaeria dothidea]
MPARPEPDTIALNPGSLHNGIVGQIFHQQLLHGEIVQLVSNVAINFQKRSAASVNMTLAASGHYADTDVMAFRGLWKTWSIKARPDRLSNNIKHSTTYQNDNESQHQENMARVRYSQCIKNKEPYVTFIFYYRWEDVLK